MPALKILRHLLSEILLDHRDLPKRHLRIGIRLQLSQHPRQHLKRAIFRIRYQKSHINEAMRVREVAEMREEHGEVGGGVSKGGAEEDSLAVVPSTFRSLHR